MVIIPDYYRGEMKDPTGFGPDVVEFLKNQTNWAKLKADYEEKILPYAEKHGAKTFGAIGKALSQAYHLSFAELSDV